MHTSHTNQVTPRPNLVLMAIISVIVASVLASIVYDGRLDSGSPLMALGKILLMAALVFTALFFGNLFLSKRGKS